MRAVRCKGAHGPPERLLPWGRLVRGLAPPDAPCHSTQARPAGPGPQGESTAGRGVPAAPAAGVAPLAAGGDVQHGNVAALIDTFFALRIPRMSLIYGSPPAHTRHFQVGSERKLHLHVPCLWLQISLHSRARRGGTG